jgi:hypothetical protein
MNPKFKPAGGLLNLKNNRIFKFGGKPGLKGYANSDRERAFQIVQLACNAGR